MNLLNKYELKTQATIAISLELGLLHWWVLNSKNIAILESPKQMVTKAIHNFILTTQIQSISLCNPLQQVFFFWTHQPQSDECQRLTFEDHQFSKYSRRGLLGLVCKQVQLGHLWKYQMGFTVQTTYPTWGTESVPWVGQYLESVTAY